MRKGEYYCDGGCQQENEQHNRRTAGKRFGAACGAYTGGGYCNTCRNIKDYTAVCAEKFGDEHRKRRCSPPCRKGEEKKVCYCENYPDGTVLLLCNLWRICVVILSASSCIERY